MSRFFQPPIWLIVFIIGLPKFAETVYTPALPEIACALKTSDMFVEYTLTIYLLGFALGILFWGNLSDRLGRKPILLAGFVIFILGCVGCAFSGSIKMLMFSRLIQALGGSAGSVLGQAISRDAFKGPALGRVYSTTGMALGVLPAIGSLVGGIIAQQTVWNHIFTFLGVCGFVLILLFVFFLPETHHQEKRGSVPLYKVLSSLLRDPKVLGFSCIVGICNGLIFSYYAEGAFYLMEILGLSPTQYGLSFTLIALSNMGGGFLSRRLQHSRSLQCIMSYGLWIMLAGALVFVCCLSLGIFLNLSTSLLIGITLMSEMILMFGSCMVTSNALAAALANYVWCIGTASSLFGCLYYSIVSLCTLGMGALHNDTLWPMPFYFLSLCVLMVIVYLTLVKDTRSWCT